MKQGDLIRTGISFAKSDKNGFSELSERFPFRDLLDVPPLRGRRHIGADES